MTFVKGKIIVENFIAMQTRILQKFTFILAANLAGIHLSGFLYSYKRGLLPGNHLKPVLECVPDRFSKYACVASKIYLFHSIVGHRSKKTSCCQCKNLLQSIQTVNNYIRTTVLCWTNTGEPYCCVPKISLSFAGLFRSILVAWRASPPNYFVVCKPMDR